MGWHSANTDKSPHRPTTCSNNRLRLFDAAISPIMWCYAAGTCTTTNKEDEIEIQSTQRKMLRLTIQTEEKGIQAAPPTRYWEQRSKLQHHWHAMERVASRWWKRWRSEHNVLTMTWTVTSSLQDHADEEIVTLDRSKTRRLRWIHAEKHWRSHASVGKRLRFDATTRLITKWNATTWHWESPGHQATDGWERLLTRTLNWAQDAVTNRAIGRPRNWWEDDTQQIPQTRIWRS